MTTTYTPALRLTQPGVGDPSVKNQWGTLVNTDMALLEAAITGESLVNLGGATTYTLSATNGAADQSRPFALVLSGAPSAGCYVTIPSVARFGIVSNVSTSGGVVLTTGSGVTLSLPANMTSFLLYQCDGTNVTTAMYATPKGTQVITASTTFVVPYLVTTIRVRLWGGGGSGESPGGNVIGGGGGGGGYAEGVYSVAPLTSYTATVGAGGVAAAAGSGLPGTSGGTTSFGSLLSATGGTAAAGQSNGAGGIGSGGALNFCGSVGQPGFVTGNTAFSGAGGATYGFAGCPSAYGSYPGSTNGIPAPAQSIYGAGGGANNAGQGGSGAIGGGLGGNGGAGLIIVDW